MISADPGSFRDPASHVVFDGERVLRLLDDRGLEAWQQLESSTFFSNAVESGRLISTTQIDDVPDGAVGALQHPRIPFVSYPYEWTFSMLKDAALLQLDLLAEALAAGITIKDATPFNIQFVEGNPVFIDIGSFEKYRDGEPWIGYRQFTRQFLFPLMLRAWADLPFQPWLRGDMEGPTAGDMKQILSGGKRLKPSALMHVSLQARMEERMSGASVRSDLKDAGFSADLILANVRKLRSLIESLTWDHGVEGWSEYQSCDHVGRDRETKAEFLRGALARSNPKRVIDLGANDGYFSVIAAEGGSLAIAVDGYEPVLEELYRTGHGENIAIVVSELTNPSPAQGWAGQERPALMDRAKPDHVIAYGVIHHLIYTASIPPVTVLNWLRSFDVPTTLEFVSPDDEMVAKLTANKLELELHPGRSEAEFRVLLDRNFSIRQEHALEGGTRVIFDLVPN